MTRRESSMPTVDESLCTLCGLCVEACPCGAVTMGDKGPIFKAPPKCQHGAPCAEDGGCCCFYLCEEVCPTGAITCSFEIVLGEDGDSIVSGDVAPGLSPANDAVATSE